MNTILFVQQNNESNAYIMRWRSNVSFFKDVMLYKTR